MTHVHIGNKNKNNGSYYLLRIDHTVRMRFKSSSLQNKFSSISITATCRKLSVLKINSSLPVRIRKFVPSGASQESTVILRGAQRLSRIIWSGLFQWHPTPHGVLLSFLKAPCSLLLERITPQLHSSITAVCQRVPVLCSVIHMC